MQKMAYELRISGWSSDVCSSYLVFPDIEPAVHARMQANGLGEAAARLLVERGVRAVQDDGGAGGFEWSSDPRLTLPTMVRMTEAQVRHLVAGLECPTRVIHADPPQPYLPEPLRSDHGRPPPAGNMVVPPPRTT